MEWELRLILAIIGIAIIGFVAFDGWRRSQQKKSIKRELGSHTGQIDPDSRDREGFDMDGVGQVRVISKDGTSTEHVSKNTENESLAIHDRDSLTASRDDDLSLSTSDHLSAKDEDESTVDTGEPELIFSLTLVAEEPFNGAELLQALIENGCRYGEMNIFHRYKSAQSTTQKYFSVANAFNPGTFDLDNMSNEVFKGISFFMAVPGAYDPETAHETMVATARELKRLLNGKLMDSSRSVFTEQTYQHEKEQIKEYKLKTLTKA